MLFENFYEDSRGHTRSAGVMETTAEEFADALFNHPNWPNIAHMSHDREKEEFHVFFRNSSFLFCLATQAEVKIVQQKLPQVPFHGW